MARSTARVSERFPGCFARLLLGVRGQVHGLCDPGADVLGRIHDLVAQYRLPVILGIQASQLADVTIDAVGLRNYFAVNLEDRHRKERRPVAEGGPVFACDAVIFERDAANV